MGKEVGYIHILLLCLPGVLGITCYNPPNNDSTPGTAQDENYTSCNPHQAVSMCCRSKVVGGTPPDACMESGLCVNTAGSAPTYWKESCTDPTWKSPICLNQFSVCSMDPWHNTEVTLCPGTKNKYCCGNSNTFCCGTATEISIAVIDGVNSTNISIPTAITPTASVQTTSVLFTSVLTTSIPTTSTPITNKLSNTSSLSPGAKGGIAAGAASAAILIIIAAILLLIRKKKRKAMMMDPTSPVIEGQMHHKEEAIDIVGYYGTSNMRSELPPFPEPWELPVGNQRVNELDVGTSRMR